MMTLERFKALCDAYGGAPQRWPEDERGAAAALLERSAAARAVLDDARALDAVLGHAGTLSASADLAARVRRSAPGPASRPAGPPAWAAMAAAVALTTGLGVGWLASGGAPAADDADVFADAFAALDSGETLALLEDA